MIIDLAHASLPLHTLCTDVLIVGTGAAGLPLALRLGERQLKVTLLEAGGKKLDANGQGEFAAESVPESHGPVHRYRRRAFGGTTAIWGGRCIPLDPIDFETRSYVENSGWPISHAAVARYYPEATTLLDAGDADFTAATALTGPAALVDGVSSDFVTLDEIERFSLPTNLGAKYCAEIARSKAITLLLNAPCKGITTNEAGNAASGGIIGLPDGRMLAVPARVVVLAAGAIESVRLLLNSRNVRGFGLGNEHDQVGRYYMAHIEGSAGRLRFLCPARDVRLDYQRTSSGVYCRRLIKLSEKAQNALGLINFLMRPYHDNIVDPSHRDPVLSAMFLAKDALVHEYARRMTSMETRIRAHYAGQGSFWSAHARNILRGLPDLSRFSVDWASRRVLAKRKLPSVVRLRADNCYPVEFNAEQAPHPESRITLGTSVDRVGMPRPRINWKCSASDRDHIKRALLTLQNAFAESTTVRFELDEAELEEASTEWTRVGGHHIGGLRMGSDPKTSVVDRNCELWNTKGVYVCGAATFPTAGAANPTLTIVALSLRLAKHLLDQLTNAPQREVTSAAIP